MHRCLAVIILLTQSACVSVVEFVERDDAGRVKSAGTLVGVAQEGIWTYYWPNGNTKAKGRYEHDTQVGPWTWWYEDGVKRTAGSYRHEHSVGHWRHWYGNGELRMTGWMEKGRKTGEWSIFAKDGALLERGQYLGGKRTSLWKFFARDNKPKAEGWFLDDTMVGPWQFFDAAGTLREATYPVPNGFELCCEHWGDGELRRAGFVANGKPVGRWLTWHDNGERRLSGDFTDGEPTGSWRAFLPDGQLLGTGPVVKSRIDGEWSVRRGGRMDTHLIGTVDRPPETFSGVWSRAAEFSASAGLAQIERWLAEATSPTGVADMVRIDRRTAAPSIAVKKTVVTERQTPTPPQMHTQRERTGLASWLRAYTEQITTDAFDFYSTRRRGSATRRDRASSRRLQGRKLAAMKFTTPNDRVIDLSAPEDGRWTLLVLLRGFAGQVCPYCPPQLKALAPFHAEFQRLGVRVVAVYPGPESGVRRFLAAYRDTFGADETPPYAILYDVDSRLARTLEILDGSIESPILARPTTIVLDSQGVIRYAYVGKNPADRPAAKTLIEKIRQLRKG